jgi:hypothetical protein
MSTTMTPAPASLVSVCEEFAGGMAATGTECIVVLKRSGEDEGVSKTGVVAGTPSGNPEELIRRMSEASGISVNEIEIFVYAIVGGARGRDV